MINTLTLVQLIEMSDTKVCVSHALALFIGADLPCLQSSHFIIEYRGLGSINAPLRRALDVRKHESCVHSGTGHRLAAPFLNTPCTEDDGSIRSETPTRIADLVRDTDSDR